jgi:glycosyltransferase involved in cell wall biosynthesis
MVGGAKMFLHNLPTGRELFLRSFGWRPYLLQSWGKQAVALAQDVRPNLIRCHGNNLNAFAALSIKRHLGVPYVVSLHGNPDVDYFRGRLGRTPLQRLIGRAIEAIEILSVQQADMVLPVYSPIVPYLEKHGVSKYEVVYNAVGQGCVPKADYQLESGLVKAVCVGRQESLQKDPSHLIEAVADLPNVQLTLIGNGDLHANLVALVGDLGISERVRFFPSMPNGRVLEEMQKSDVFVYSSMNYEISKACMEAALIGLPIVVNDRDGCPATELVGQHFSLVPNTREAYRTALRDLIGDVREREKLGRAARCFALSHWSPDRMERRVTDIYRSLIHSSSICTVSS